MVHANQELGAGIWWTKHHVWGSAAWISESNLFSPGGFFACSWHATVVAVIYNTKTEGPRKNFQPSYYHRRSAFTDFSSHTRNLWIYRRIPKHLHYWCDRQWKDLHGLCLWHGSMQALLYSTLCTASWTVAETDGSWSQESFRTDTHKTKKILNVLLFPFSRKWMVSAKMQWRKHPCRCYHGSNILWFVQNRDRKFWSI